VQGQGAAPATEPAPREWPAAAGLRKAVSPLRSATALQIGDLAARGEPKLWKAEENGDA